MSSRSRTWLATESVLLALPVALLAVYIACPTPLLAQRGESATVDIRVTDESEVPLDQAEVRLYAQGAGGYSLRAFTSAGMVEFQSVGGGGYTLEVVKDSYDAHREQIDIASGITQMFSVTLRRLPNVAPRRVPGNTVSTATLAIPGSARREFEAGIAQLAKDPVGSIEHFHKAIKEYPDYSEAYAWLSLAYMQEKQNADALSAVKKAIALDPKLAMAHALLGRLYFQEKKFSEAEPELLQSIQLNPQSWDAPFELARCYFNMGKLDKSLQYARQANAVPQASPVTHLLLVDIYLRQGDKKDALEELQTFAKVAPESPLTPRVKQRIQQLSKPN